jgi:L-threonine ammonia-lyase (EC 4.3.1.19)
MAGLACGEPSLVSWGLLRDYSDLYISCADYFTAKGMRILGNPLGDDPKVISGESGAVGLGILTMTLQEESLKDLAHELKLEKDSRILIISTEGDTDPEQYRKIVWDGLYPSY